MVALGYVLSALVMGLILVGIVVFVTRMDWQHYAPEGRRRGALATGERLLGNPAVWTLAFLLLALGSGAAAILALGGVAVDRATRDLAMIAVFGAFAAALGVALAFSTYRSARFRGLNRAQAAGVGGWTVGLLLILSVVVKLATTG